MTRDLRHFSHGHIFWQFCRENRASTEKVEQYSIQNVWIKSRFISTILTLYHNYYAAHKDKCSS